MTHLGDNRLFILQNAASAYGDYVDFLTTYLSLVHVIPPDDLVGTLYKSISKLGLAPHGMDLGSLGFGLLGLGLGLWDWAWALGLGLGFGIGPHLYFMSSFNFEKTRRKNIKCEGGCPLPPLIKASFI